MSDNFNYFIYRHYYKDEIIPFIRSFHSSALHFKVKYSPSAKCLYSPLNALNPIRRTKCGPPMVRWAKGGGRHNEGYDDLPLDVWFY